MGNSQWYTVVSRLDGITTLLQQLVDAAHGRSAITARAVDEPTIKEAGAIGWTYELHVPEEPPVGTVLIGQSDAVMTRRTSGWQVNQSIMTTAWINVLNLYGPLKVIHQPEGEPVD